MRGSHDPIPNRLFFLVKLEGCRRALSRCTDMLISASLRYTGKKKITTQSASFMVSAKKSYALRGCHSLM